MRKLTVYIISVFIIFCIIFGAGFYTAYKTMKPKTVEITKEVVVTRNIDKIVYRDIEKLNFTECKEIVSKYDKEPMLIDYTVNELHKKYTDINVNWKLYERSGMQNIKIPVYQQGNWEFYIGAGLGVLATAGAVYGGYKIFKGVK